MDDDLKDNYKRDIIDLFMIIHVQYKTEIENHFRRHLGDTDIFILFFSIHIFYSVIFK